MQIVHDYRALHAIPELDRNLPKTLAYIRNSLSSLSCHVFSPAEGALCAFFDFGQSSALAFRADMDALPIREQTGLPWASQHPGLMHACGHDGHCAILLELARRLSNENHLRHNCLLIFQPAEETTGGAEQICKAGVLTQYKVEAVFGLHLWPGLAKGILFSRPGVLMSRGQGVTVQFTGKAAHIARWQQGQDALSACCLFYRQADRLTNRIHLIKFGKLAGGSAGNIVCDKVQLQGSLRTLKSHEKAQKKLTALCAAVARRTGCQGNILFENGYPAVLNTPRLFQKAAACFPLQHLKQAFFTTEDFSYYQNRVPGLYCLLGLGDTPPLHSDRFAFDEKVLVTGADFFHTLARKL